MPKNLLNFYSLTNGESSLLRFLLGENSQLLTQFLVILLQLAHLFLNRLQYISNFVLGEARNDVLLTIPIERLHLDYVDSLDGCFVAGIANFFYPFFGQFALKYLGMAKNFEAQLSGIIDRDYRHAVILCKIAGADVLLVATKIRECQGATVDYFQKAFGPAAMLDVWPSGFPYSGDIKSISFTEVLYFIWSEVSRDSGSVLHACVLSTAAISLLQGFHCWRENK
jgi:hypothetical protein